MQDDVYFQVVADAGADGARPLADIGVGLRAALKQAIRAGKPTHSYIVGHVTYTVDFHSWLVTDSVTHNVRPLRVVARKLAIADQTTPLGDNAPVGAVEEAELALSQLQILPASMNTFKLSQAECVSLKEKQEAALMKKNDSCIVVADATALLKTVTTMLERAR